MLRYLVNFINVTGGAIDNTIQKAVQNARFFAIMFSFSLGSITAFYVRDEFNFPTYLRIKEVYLTNTARQMREPDVRILRVIDPLTHFEVRVKKDK